jgi:lysophospholipase L1-like esterase
MTRARRRLLALGLGLLLLFVLLAIGNAYARSQGFGAGLVMDNVGVPDAVGWRWLPDQHVDSPHGFPIDINSDGLRDPREVVTPKPEGVFRILCVGDSFTFGIETPQDRAYPAMLEQILTDAVGGLTVEVWNAGVNGLNSCQEQAWLDHYGWALEPDIVAVGFVMNDVIPIPKSSMPRWFPGRTWMLRYPLYHYLRHNVINRWRLGGDDQEANQLKHLIRQHQGKVETSPSSNDVTKRWWNRATECLGALAMQCRERDVPVALVVFPSLPQMLKPDPLPEPQDVLTALAGERGFILVDLLDRYAAIGEPALLESDKAHPSLIGHRIAAEELARALSAEGALPR